MTRLLSSLSNRIFLAATLLAWLSIAAALLFVNARLAQESERALDRRLIETTSLVQQQQQALVDTFTRMALLVADLPKLKAAMATGDAPTVAPIAAQYLTDLAADLLLVADADGTVLASAGSAGAGLGDATVRQLGVLPAGTRLHPHPRGVLQVVTVPVQLGVESPERLGALSVGFLLDDRRAAQLKRITGVDLAFAVDGRVLASTLAPAMAEGWPTRLDGLGSGRVRIDSTEYAWRAQAIDAPDAARAATGPGGPVVVVLEPTAPSAATLQAVRMALGGIALVTAALAVAVGYAVARTVTRPLATITDAMRDVATTGDLTRRITIHDRGLWHDEDTRLLATTFNALTESIGTFQREARERERLSALGRLSTVIAHEIRNPLMIMRGALRQLTRPTATRTDIREAASDIEGEVQRLARVVDDVLDFARPVQLDLAPTDINAVCAEAAGAVKAARPDADISLTFAPDDPVIACDADRLRTVLVNVLTNAYQAAETLGDTPVVAMTVDRPGDAGHIRIQVRDTGPGIADNDLPHVFDPYFTTRRTGTGLGLPIARAIVLGLGGAIGIESASSRGTTVTIELGRERTP